MDRVTNREGRREYYAGDDDQPFPRTSIDNALKQAFRSVLGWDPHRDGVPHWRQKHGGSGPKLPDLLEVEKST